MKIIRMESSANSPDNWLFTEECIFIDFIADLIIKSFSIFMGTSVGISSDAIYCLSAAEVRKLIWSNRRFFKPDFFRIICPPLNKIAQFDWMFMVLPLMSASAGLVKRKIAGDILAEVFEKFSLRQASWILFIFIKTPKKKNEQVREAIVPFLL